MAKYVGYKRPKDTKKTVKHLLTYLGHYKWAFLLIAILVFISAGAGIMGTFLIKPVVNNFIVPGNIKGLIMAVRLSDDSKYFGDVVLSVIVYFS